MAQRAMHTGLAPWPSRFRLEHREAVAAVSALMLVLGAPCHRKLMPTTVRCRTAASEHRFVAGAMVAQPFIVVLLRLLTAMACRTRKFPRFRRPAENRRQSPPSAHMREHSTAFLTQHCPLPKPKLHIQGLRSPAFRLHPASPRAPSFARQQACHSTFSPAAQYGVQATTAAPLCGHAVPIGERRPFLQLPRSSATLPSRGQSDMRRVSPSHTRASARKCVLAGAPAGILRSID